MVDALFLTKGLFFLPKSASTKWLTRLRTGERADGRRGALDANPPRTVEDEPATATLYKLPHTPRNGELQPTTALDTENLPSSWPPHRNSENYRTSIEHLSIERKNTCRGGCFRAWFWSSLAVNESRRVVRDDFGRPLQWMSRMLCGGVVTNQFSNQ